MSWFLPQPSPSSVSKFSILLRFLVCPRSSLAYWRERGRVWGWARSQIIRPRESLVLNKSFTYLVHIHLIMTFGFPCKIYTTRCYCQVPLLNKKLENYSKKKEKKYLKKIPSSGVGCRAGFSSSEADTHLSFYFPGNLAKKMCRTCSIYFNHF